MDKNLKLGLGIGCGLVVLFVVGVLGVGTWYAGRINAEYKEVRETEKALLAATEAENGFRPPSSGIPTQDRIKVFLEVREELDSWRGTVATANAQFEADRERQQSGLWKDLARVVNTGSDLMPLYAGFWVARNEALLKHGMGPGEYTYIYGLVYRTWLEPDRPAVSAQDYPANALTVAFEPYRERFTAAFHPDVDPLELIFEGDRE